MKRIWPLAALGVLAYLVFALFTVPASLVLGRLQPYGVNAAGVTGTAWNGSAEVVQVAGASLGALTWKLRVLPLFTLRAVADIKVQRSDGFAQGTVSASAGRVELRDATAALPIAALPAQVAQGGWTGSLNAKLASLTLTNGWPTSAAGTIEVVDLTGPARKPMNIGSYQLTFPAEGPADALTGAVKDLGGPIQITGTIQLKAADRSYLLEALVATTPDAPADFTKALEYLPADAQGRREFSLSGTM